MFELNIAAECPANQAIRLSLPAVKSAGVGYDIICRVRLQII
jgi:hypothetical protein